jgi:hypothetical protein
VVQLGRSTFFVALGIHNFDGRAGYDSASIVAFIPLFLRDIFLGIAGFFLHTDDGQTT